MKDQVHETLAKGNYQKARELFLKYARDCGEKTPHLVDHQAEPFAEIKGRDGEDLFVDFVSIGDREAESLLVVSSGVHGVEGFAGALAQIQTLKDLLRGHYQLSKNVRILFIFAINPYGMSWNKRTDHQNIDVNRNFIDFTSPLPRNERYQKYESFLNHPLDPFKNLQGLFTLSSTACRLISYRATGQQKQISAVSDAITNGQYENEVGIFYGGSHPSLSRKILNSYFEERVFGKNVRRCIWLDIHTGLGEKGATTPIACTTENCDFSSVQKKVAAIFGPEMSDRLDGEQSARSGKMLSMMLSKMDNSLVGDFLGLTVEIGTHNPVRVLLDLRRENLERGQADKEKSDKGSLNTFFIDEIEWTEAVANGIEQLFSKALCYLNPS